MRKGLPVQRGCRLGAAVLAVLVASGCGGGKSEPEQTGGETGKMEERLPGAELVIHSSSTWSEELFDEKFGNALRAKFPEHKIQYIKHAKGSTYADLIAAGTSIDLVFESVAQLPAGPLQYGLAYDMTDLLKKRNVDTGKMEPSLLESTRATYGKLYGIPVASNTLALYYNKDLFNKFGVPYPKDRMMWEEALELNKKLTRQDSGVQYTGLSFSIPHMLRLNPFSLPYVDPKTEKTTIETNPKWRTLFEMLAVDPLSAQGYLNGRNTLPTDASFFKEQTSAMLVALMNTHANQQQIPFEWDMVGFPYVKEAPDTGPQSYPTYFAVTAGSKYKEQGIEMIRYLISEEFQLEVSKTGTLPVINSPEIMKAFGQGTKFKDKNLKSAFYTKYAPVSAKSVYDGQVEKVLMKAVSDIVQGTADMNTALRTAEEEANKAIASIKGN